MKQALETYQLELKVRGPVFVGSGREIGKKEYIFLNRNTVGVLDISAFYSLIKKKGLESEFERFMVMDVKENLKSWVEKKNLFREIKSCMKYTMNAGDIQMNKGRMSIMECVADPYGNPYIPGSSIKGMLRTILLCSDILRNPQKYKYDSRTMENDLDELRVSRKKVLAPNINNVEAKAFRTLKRNEKRWYDAVNDIMAGIIISDSEPLSREDIILCQKWELHKNGTYKTLNLLRECIKPGTVIRCSLTIDRTLCKLSKEEISDAIQLFYENYYECFQRKFKSVDRAADHTVFLGGGSGFVSKTIIYALYGEKKGIEITKRIFEKTGVPGNHKHYQDSRLGVSPHIVKCTRYQGKDYMMGQCELTIRG